MDKIRVGDIITIEYLYSIVRVRVLGMHGDKLLVRGLRLLGFIPSYIGKRVISRSDYYFYDFELLNPKICQR